MAAAGMFEGMRIHPIMMAGMEFWVAKYAYSYTLVESNTLWADFQLYDETFFLLPSICHFLPKMYSHGSSNLLEE